MHWQKHFTLCIKTVCTVRTPLSTSEGMTLDTTPLVHSISRLSKFGLKYFYAILIRIPKNDSRLTETVFAD